MSRHLSLPECCLCFDDCSALPFDKILSLLVEYISWFLLCQFPTLLIPIFVIVDELGTDPVGITECEVLTGHS